MWERPDFELVALGAEVTAYLGTGTEDGSTAV
jgi:coenzyme PQQ precursor peptide PqqA